MTRLNRKGQGMLEYIIIIAVVLAAILTFANAGLRNAVTSIFNGSTTVMQSAASNINVQ